MKKSEKLRLICLELALATPCTDDTMAKAREYYAFVKERDGGNAITTTSKLSRVK